MRRFALFCVFMLFVHYSVQIPKYEHCLSAVLPASDRERCVKVTCTSQNRYNIEECRCDKDAALHLGERHSEYPACCPRCAATEDRNSRKRH